MKELSIEEKAKAYDEAIKRVENIKTGKCKTTFMFTEGLFEHIFPELKESEDEDILKGLISMCKTLCKTKWIAWLEKQGENKPADKVEPKFQNGQWIVWQNKCYKVNYNGCGYELIDQNGLSTSLEYVTVDENAHLWTIQDAKDGDVLVYRDGQWCFIYKGIVTEDTFKYYALLSEKGITVNDAAFSLLTSCIIPATNEQRDLLFQKMKEAGYKWDAERKELRKIEQKPAEWSEEDESIALGIEQLCYCASLLSIAPDKVYKIRTWLKDLKDRVQPQPKQEWSERDKEEFQIAIDTLVEAGQHDSANWLKSLRPKSQWKPSDAQMVALKCAITTSDEKWVCMNTKDLESLYEELKRLREE